MEDMPRRDAVHALAVSAPGDTSPADTARGG